MGRKDMNRREFIGKTAAGFFSAGIGLPLLRGKARAQEQSDKIIYRTLGRTKLRIPILSFGVMNSDSSDLIRKAIDMGINHLDTAYAYLRGNSELSIGKTLEEGGVRDKVYIGTKMRFARDNDMNVFISSGPAREPLATKENFQKQLETSLQRLRTDYVDILYLHSAYSPEMATFEPMVEELIKAKKEGKARFIGVSTHKNEPDVIRAAVDANIYDVILTAYGIVQEYKEDVKKAIQYAASKDIGIIAMKTHGGVSRNKDPNSGIDHATAFKWVLSDENVNTTIPGMTTFEQLDFNFKVMNDYGLSVKESRAIQKTDLYENPLYCQNCRSCVSTCPQRVEIPSLMRSFMYAESYGNLIQAELTLDVLPEDKGLDACRACALCTATCAYGINISDRLKSLKAQGFARS
jgi:predicted aldo/keto reductase-like oxidoreductase